MAEPTAAPSAPVGRARSPRPPIRLEVLRTERLTPHLVRLTLGGPGFAAFHDNGFTDRYVKLVFPRPGRTLPEPLDMAEVRSLPHEERPLTRTYTVSRYDAEARELAIDFVVHGDEGIAGPWAAAAQPGDEVVMIGPGGSYRPSPDADWHLVVGDEAALPAIAAALAAMPAGAVVHAVVEVEDASEELPLPTEADLHLTWLHRAGGPSTLAAAVKALDLPEGRVECFVHGELGMIRELRPYLVEERQVPGDLLSISGYWRHGKDEDGFQAEKRRDPVT